MCQQIRDNAIPIHPPGDDPRIKSFVIADPVSFFPDQASLRSAKRPMQLWSSELGGMGVRPEEVTAVKTNLPHAPEFHRADGAGHLSFQFPCTDEVAKLMSFVCTDPPGFNRKSFHATLNAQLLDFFRRQLLDGAESAASANSG